MFKCPKVQGSSFPRKQGIHPFCFLFPNCPLSILFCYSRESRESIWYLLLVFPQLFIVHHSFLYKPHTSSNPILFERIRPSSASSYFLSSFFHPSFPNYSLYFPACALSLSPCSTGSTCTWVHCVARHLCSAKQSLSLCIRAQCSDP